MTPEEYREGLRIHQEKLNREYADAFIKVYEKIYNEMIDLRKENQPSQEVIKLIALSGYEKQGELAEKLGVRPASISDYKTGKTAISVNTLKAWCDILNINIKKLF